MSRIAIIYISTHHQNTEKVVKSMAEEVKADLIHLNDINKVNIADYDVIGFASGIYFSSFNPAIKKIIKDSIFLENQKIFLTYTCGVNCINYANGIEKILKNKQCKYCGCFSCNGYDTYGIFGKFGGIKKGRPNENDLKNAREFIKSIL